MTIDTLKNLNVTLLLESNIDHNAVSNKQIFEVASEITDDLEHLIMEGPEVKIFQFPKLDYNLIVESKRLLVNDKSGKDINKSEIISKIIKLYEVIGGETKAYGFNFDYIVTADDFSASDLFGERLSSFNDIREAGATLRFDSDGTDVGLDIKPIKDKKGKFLIHINVHHNKPFTVDESVLKQELSTSEVIADKIISKI